MNAIRIWLAFDAFVGREDAFKRDFESYIRAVDAIGCKAMPILFNRWRGLPDWGTIAIDHSECCWGEEDDAAHIKSIVYSLSQLSKRGIGFMPDSLHHSLVGDEHRREFGPVGVEFMAFIEADGRLRAGHEIYNNF